MEKQCIHLFLNKKGEVVSFYGAPNICAHVNMEHCNFHSPCCPEPFQRVNFHALLQSYGQIEISTVLNQQIWSGSLRLMQSMLPDHESDYLLLSLEQSVDSLSSSVGNRQQLMQDQVSLLDRASPSLIYQMRVIQPVFNENTSDQSISEKSIDEQQILKQRIDILAVSPGIETVIGYAPEDIICIPGWWINQIHPQDIVKFNQHLRACQHGNTTSVFACEYRVKNRQGDYIWLADRSRKLQNADKQSESITLVGAIVDISDIMCVYHQLKSLMAVVPGMLYQYERYTDGSAFFSYMSPQVQSLFGLTPDDVVRDATLLFNSIHPSDRRRMYHSVLKAEKTKVEWKCEFRVLNQGEVRWLLGHSVLVRNDQKRQLWSGLIIDISDKKSLEFKLKRESTIDPLTGVFNRRYFMNMLANVFDSCLKSRGCTSILAVDFDLFKQINDQYGHDVGDEVLKQVAAGMRRHLRRTDTLARVGGEEFSVILPDTSHNDARHIGEKLRRYVEQMKIHCQDFEIQITITVGVASTNGDLTQRELLISADRALYRGKSAGRNCVV